MNMSLERAALCSIACHGRVNIGNFDNEMQEVVASLITTGLVSPRADENREETLWCYLTHAGSERLYTLNSEVELAWNMYTWNSPEA